MKEALILPGGGPWYILMNMSCKAILLLITLCISGASADWIDMDTPLDKRTTTSLVDGSTYHLVRLLLCVISRCILPISLFTLRPLSLSLS